MQIIRHLPASSDEPSAIAIGNFDGMHLGHRMVIRTMVRAARAARAVPSVLTFEPHPRKFFMPQGPNFRIATLRDKLHGLRVLGVRQVFAPRFDATIASILAEDFLHRVLGHQLDAKVVVVGEGFVFGHQRRGTVAMLKAWGHTNQVKIIVVPPVTVDGALCSSSAVRAALTQGDMAAAATLLGRPYQLQGSVAPGAGRGRTLGFPTANVTLPGTVMLPMHGVYAVRARVAEAEYHGVANLGLRPTIGVDVTPTLEVHLFDAAPDLYGKIMGVMLMQKIRDEQKFDTLDALRAQIARDGLVARHVLESC